MEEKRKYLELTSDVVFKEFMMSENTREFKADLINAITNLPIKDLLKAEYSSKELVGKNKKDKVFRTDIIVEIKDKNILVLEMNHQYYIGVTAKTHDYSSRLLSEQLEQGEDYTEIKEIIEISFNDFSVLDHNRLINELAIVNLSTGKEVPEMNWRGFQIDLKTLTDKCYNKDEEKIVDLFKIFSNDENIIKDLKGKNENMDKALNELERISSDERIIGLYDVEAVERKVLNSKIKTAELIGMEEGMEKGMKKGTENVASNMLRKGRSIEDIADCTGLTPERINELKESLK